MSERTYRSVKARALYKLAFVLRLKVYQVEEIGINDDRCSALYNSKCIHKKLRGKTENHSKEKIHPPTMKKEINGRSTSKFPREKFVLFHRRG